MATVLTFRRDFSFSIFDFYFFYFSFFQFLFSFLVFRFNFCFYDFSIVDIFSTCYVYVFIMCVFVLVVVCFGCQDVLFCVYLVLFVLILLWI